MAGQRKSRAFRRGFWPAAIASAGLVIWNAPQSGARTREQIVEAVEGVLFSLLDMTDRLSTVTTADAEPAGVVVRTSEPVILEPAGADPVPAGIPI